jgi:hypothetical protein
VARFFFETANLGNGREWNPIYRSGKFHVPRIAPVVDIDPLTLEVCPLPLGACQLQARLSKSDIPRQYRQHRLRN